MKSTFTYILFLSVYCLGFSQNTIDLNASENKNYQDGDSLNIQNLPAYVSISEFILHSAIKNNEIIIGDKILFDFENFQNKEGEVTYKNTDLNNVTSYICKFKYFQFSQAFISVNNNEYSISIDIPEQGRKFKNFVSNDRVNNYLVELDTANLDYLQCNDSLLETQPDVNPLEKKTLPNQDTLPNKNLNEPKGKSLGSIQLKSGIGCASLGDDDPADINVLVLYTQASLTYAGSQQNMDNKIAQAMTRANNASSNSNLGMNFTLAHSELTTYAESTAGSSTDLSNLANKTDGFMDNVHMLRDTHAADFVHLITFVTDTGGIAYILNSQSGSESGAFGITRVQQLDWSDTLIHEVGHNMGCSHAKGQNVQAGPTNWYDWPGNTWSAGWRFQGNDTNYYTSVMAYGSASSWPDGIASTDISYFSTPLINFQGQPVGNAVDGDNVRSLKRVKQIVSKYRDANTSRYCLASGSNPSNVNLTISDISLNGLTNPSTWSSYNDFSYKRTCLTIGQTYPLTVDVAGTFGGAKLMVWVDWNNDFDFDDANELVLNSAIGSSLQYNIDVTPPYSAVIGEVRMRIRYEAASSSYSGTGAPCGTSSFGEVEDYTINLEQDGYIYHDSAWSPRSPSGVSTAADNITVINGDTFLNNNTVANNLVIKTGASLKSASIKVNNLTIETGASLEAANGDVSIAGNVVNNGAITGSNQVILNSATAAVSGTGTMTNLTVGGSGVATITGSQSITAQLDVVSGGTLNADGNITLVSNALGTARVDEMDDGAIIGDVNVERYIPAGNRAFRFIGPTVSGPTVFNSWQEAGNNAGGFGVQVTGTAGTVGVVNATSGHDETATGAASMFKWDVAGQAWVIVANTKNEVLNAGAYYRLFVRGDRTTDLSNNAAAHTATTLRASGSLMQTSMVVTPGIANGEFFAVANPYQSKVSMAITAASTNADMYYWDPNLGENGGYSAIDITTGIGTAGFATNVLDPGQAVFFVDANAAASVTIAQTDKIGGNDNAVVFRTNTLQQALRLKLYQTSRYNNNQSESDGLYLDFDAAHSLNVDLNDATKLNGLNVNMAIEKPTGERLAVERRTLPTSAETINLNISNYLTTHYTLVATVDALPGLIAFMKDNLNGNRTELVEGTSTPVHFTVDSTNAQSMEASRFEIVFELVTLGNEAIAFGDQLTIYPNPVDGDLMNIRMDGSSASSIDVAVFNTLGQQVMTRSYDQVTDNIQIDNLSSLSKGLYFVKISNDSQQATLKFIKE